MNKTNEAAEQAMSLKLDLVTHDVSDRWYTHVEQYQPGHRKHLYGFLAAAVQG